MSMANGNQFSNSHNEFHFMQERRGRDVVHHWLHGMHSAGKSTLSTNRIAIYIKDHCSREENTGIDSLASYSDKN